MSELNGVLLVDKPVGMTSHDVVGKIRRLFNTKSVGHCGTLDPMASGLLIMLLGSATKLSDYLLTQDKSYLTTVKLGVTTDSYDMEGEVTSETETSSLTASDLDQALSSMTGDLELEIPIFSAKKVNGKKLYELAREGESIELPKKIMKFYDLEVVEKDSSAVKAKVSCSKGSFIRAWGHELGKKLGVGGTLSELRRLESKPFHVNQSVSLEALERIKEVHGEIELSDIKEHFIGAAQALSHLKLIVADTKEKKLISNGQIPHSISSRLVFELKTAQKQKEPVGIRVVSPEQSLLAILQATPDKGLKIRRVFK